MKDPNTRTELILPPFSDGTANSNVAYYATATDHATSTIPAGWAGRWVRVKAITTDAWVLFGSAAGIAVDRTLTAQNTNLGSRVFAGTYEDFWLPRNTTHISVEAAASGAVEVLLTNPTKTQEETQT